MIHKYSCTNTVPIVNNITFPTALASIAVGRKASRKGNNFSKSGAILLITKGSKAITIRYTGIELNSSPTNCDQ